MLSTRIVRAQDDQENGGINVTAKICGKELDLNSFSIGNRVLQSDPKSKIQPNPKAGFGFRRVHAFNRFLNSD